MRQKSMSFHNSNRDTLSKFLPAETINDILLFIEKHRIAFKITNERKTKLGDYTCPHAHNQFHKITINGNLSKYAFLLVCLHEFAHLKVWLQYKRTVNPHGKEWKTEYQRFVQYYINIDLFPTDLKLALIKHIQNPSATTSSNQELLKTLQKYDTKYIESDKVFLSELTLGTFFQFSGKTFQLLEKLRTRYKCKSIENNKLYLVQQTALVKVIEQN